jgi:hypothetical protein
MAGTLFEVADDLDVYYQVVQDHKWSDGLPVVPPTEERLRRFLDYIERDPDQVVSVLPPFAGAATVKAVAVNAIMAGCRPEYLPVVLAAVEAIADPDMDLHSLQVDVNAATVVLIVNGPIRDAIGMNWAGDCLGGGTRANATIGRAVRLCMMNIGGARPPDSDTTIHGQPGRISMCLAEDEDGSPWPGLHVDRGFSPTDSVVTVTGVTGTQNLITGVHGPDAMLTLMADAICTMGSNTVLLGAGDGQGHGGGPVVVFSRGLANLLARDGLSKSDVKRILFERAHKPERLMPMTKAAHRYEQFIVRDEEIYALRSADQAMVVVAGYDSPNHTCLMPNYVVSGVASRRITLPSSS